MNLKDLTVKQVLQALFFDAAQDTCLFDVEDDADGWGEHDPEDVRFDLSSCIDEVLYKVGVMNSAENCGEATDMVLEAWPNLAEYLAVTTDR